jgi:hypothetical protein
MIRRGLNLNLQEYHALKDQFHDALDEAGLLEGRINISKKKKKKSVVLGLIAALVPQPANYPDD